MEMENTPSKPILTSHIGKVIIEYLPLTDQLNLIRAVPQYKKAFVEWNESNFVHFSSGLFENEDACDIVSLCGRYIRSMDFDECSINQHKIVKCASEFGTNLESISIDTRDYDSAEYLQKIISLKTISLKKHKDACGHYVNQFIDAICELKNLKNVHLAGFDLYMLRRLHCLTNMENLSISNIPQLCPQTINLQSIWAQLENLRQLQINSKVTLSFEGVDLPNLESIELFDVHVRGSLPYYPKLRSIALSSETSFLSSIFGSNIDRYAHQLDVFKFLAGMSTDSAEVIGHLAKLTELHCKPSDNALLYLTVLQHLKYLNVGFKYVRITNFGLIRLIRRCQSLTTLNVESCKSVTEDFIFALLDILIERGVKNPGSFSLYARLSGINANIIEELKEKDAANLITIYI